MTDELIERLARLHRHYESGGMGGDKAAKANKDASARIIADAKIIEAADELAIVVAGLLDVMPAHKMELPVKHALAAYRAAALEKSDDCQHKKLERGLHTIPHKGENL